MLRRMIGVGLVWTAAATCLVWSEEVERIRNGNLLIEGVPEIPQSTIDRLFQYQNTRSVSLQDWSPRGDGIAIGTRFAETTQLHFIERAGGARTQLTFFPEPVGSANYCPDPSVDLLLFTMDVGGGEFYQIHSFDRQTGKSVMITDGKSRNGNMLWSESGKQFAFTSTKRNGRDYDIYISHRDALNEAAIVVQEGGMWSSLDWSPDEMQLLVKKYISINESYLYMLDVETGKLTQINPSSEKIAYGSAVWSKDSKGIYLTSDEAGEFMRLRFYDPANRNLTSLTDDLNWDVDDMVISKQRDRIAFTTNEHGASKLFLLDTDSLERIAVTDVPLGVVYGLDFDPAGERLAMVVGTPQSPGDLYVLNLASSQLERWTQSEIGGLNPNTFVSPQLIEYPTFDTVEGKPRTIPAFYYKPAKGNGPFPVLIEIHGGPESQYRPYFNPLTQYYVNELGITVLAPNVRGSSGYGKSYLLLDNGLRREDSVKDIGALLDWIARQPELDDSRVAVIGGSYGGYMVLACMTHFNDRLRAGIEIVGISNFVTFLQNTQEYRRDLRRAEYGDERDPTMKEFLQSISPTTNAGNITKPMLVAQGLNDPRVPAGEAEQIVKAIRNNGGSAWYILAEDEGHGFAKKTNRDYYQQAVAVFLQRFLMGE